MNALTPETPGGPGTPQSPVRRLITISIPVYNEEGNIARLLERLNAFAASEAERFDFEFLFTDNASEDRTYELLAEAGKTDPRIRILRFSRNFGFQRSVLTNFINARGDAAVQLDADLQDPPELISEFIKHWDKGYKVVYGIRRVRKESWLLNKARRRYYRLVRSLSEVPVPKDAGDFRLIDRVVIDHLKTIEDQAPYVRGIIASLGYPQVGVRYERDVRKAGKSKFGLSKLIFLGVDGITSQSTKPLSYITLFGFAMCGLTVLVGLAYLALFLTNRSNLTPGFTTLVLMLLFSIGMNALMIGMVGEYVGRIFNNVRGHPFTIVERDFEQGREVQRLDAVKGGEIIS